MKLVRLVAAMLAIGIVFFSLGCREESQPLRFTLTFQDLKSLQPGQFVVYNGLRIGTVRSVDLAPGGIGTVGVEVDSRYRHLVYREATFIIEKPNGMLDVSGEKQITMKDRGSVKTTVAQADVLRGSEGLLHSAAQTAKDVAVKVMDAVETAVQDPAE